MSATEVVANMPLHSATVRVNKHKADWRGWKFMWPLRDAAARVCSGECLDY